MVNNDIFKDQLENQQKKFLLQDSDCSYLSNENKNQIVVYILDLDTSDHICDLDDFEVDLSDCQNTYKLILQNLIIIEDKNEIKYIEDEVFVISEFDFSIQYLLDIEIYNAKFNNITMDLYMYGISDKVLFQNVIFQNLQNEEQKTMYLRELKDVQFNNCKFLDLLQSDTASSYYGAAFYILNYNSLIITNSQFDNLSGYQGIIFLKYGNYIYIDNCIFNNIRGNRQLILYVQEIIDADITNSQITNISAENTNAGGIAYINQVYDIQITNSTIRNTVVYAGSFYLDADQLTDSSKINLQIQDIAFNNLDSINSFLGFYINDYFNCIQEKCQISNLFLQNGTSIGTGGLLYNRNCNNMIIENMTVYDTDTDGANSLYFRGNQNLIIKNGYFKGNSGLSNGLYIIDSVNFSIENITIQNSNKRSIYITSSQQISITNFKLLNLTAISSSTCSMFITTCENIYLQDFIIKNNSDSRNSNYILSSKYIYIQNGKYENNFVTSDVSGIYFRDSSDIYIQDTVFNNNTAGSSAPVLYGMTINNINLKNIQIWDNLSKLEMGAIYLVSSENVLFDNVNFKNNSAYALGGSLMIDSSNQIQIINTQIQLSKTEREGGGIYFLNSNNIEIQNVNFYNNTSLYKDGGALTIEGCDTVQLSDLEFQYNFGKKGGAVAIIVSKNIQAQNIEFYNNEALSLGGGIYLLEAQNFEFYNVTINNCLSVQAGGGLYLNYCQDGNFQNMQINDNICTEGNGGAIYLIDQCNNINLDEIEIKNNRVYGNNGAGIYSSFNQKLIIKNTKIESNFGAEYGGGIYCDKSDSLYIQDVLFDNMIIEDDNYQQLKGGAIFISQLNFFKSESVIYKNNQVLFQGGAIYFNDVQEIEFKNTEFTNNKALSDNYNDQLLYGGAIYCQTSQKMIITNTNFVNNYAYSKGGAIYIEDIQNLEIKQNQFKNNKVNYGTIRSVYEKSMGYVITYGGGIFLEQKHSSILSNFSIFKSIFDGSQASSGGAIMFILRPGQSADFQFEDILFKNNQADLGPSIRFLGDQNYIFEQIQQNQNDNKQIQFVNEIGKLSENQVFSGFFRNEKLINKQNYNFELCSKGLYLKGGGKTYCDSCIEEGECDGGYTPIYPKPQYWRSSNETSNFLYCENNIDACAGNDTCAEGYKGPMCEQCDLVQRYNKSGNKCEKCNSKFFVFFKFAGLSLLVMVLIGYQMNGNPQSTFSSGMLCMFQIESEQEYKEKISYFISVYSLAAILGALLLAIVVEIGLYFSFSFFRHKRELIDFIKCSCICFLLTIQPGVLQTSLLYAKCRDIDGIQYSTADLGINCSESFYKGTVLPISLLGTFIFGIVFPFFCIYRLYQGSKKQLLGTLTFQKKYGVLFIECKQQHYYWEIISMLMKVCAVIISIIFNDKPSLKGSLICLVLMIYSKVCQKKYPYVSNKLNEYQILSIYVSLMTTILTISISLVEEEAKLRWMKLRVNLRNFLQSEAKSDKQNLSFTRDKILNTLRENSSFVLQSNQQGHKKNNFNSSIVKSKCVKQQKKQDQSYTVDGQKFPFLDTNINTNKQSTQKSLNKFQRNNQKYGSNILFPSSFASTMILNDSNVKLNLKDLSPGNIDKNMSQINKNDNYDDNNNNYEDFSSFELEKDNIYELQFQQLPFESSISNKKLGSQIFNDSSSNNLNSILKQQNKFKKDKFNSINSSPEIINPINNQKIKKNNSHIYQYKDFADNNMVNEELDSNEDDAINDLDYNNDKNINILDFGSQTGSTFNNLAIKKNNSNDSINQNESPLSIQADIYESSNRLYQYKQCNKIGVNGKQKNSIFFKQNKKQSKNQLESNKGDNSNLVNFN
ncbi:Pectin lyase fold/virulence factor [Pseudocohnilembus persalinus]|uniref:Pectin lyase fold/virulence factor n=1 Tax=Pseudocohnilembus persalinus TaxID=266149 RepID=A0A0V0QL91_PSEPJ|nr:Pectin lyase fold/virulence factor [Pseudocohnilembus persalinus]|eukprot:KRX02998.1 Pectin lyase fold/virulence factor [Pseudocohnilembus persalinus]